MALETTTTTHLPAPPKMDPADKRKKWREMRGHCVVRSEEACPPSRYEAAVAARFSTLRKLVFGPQRRRFLPEVAALTIMAQRRYKWTLGRLAKEIGTNQYSIFCYRWGLVPLHRNGTPNEIPLIRMSAIVDLGEVECWEIWKRCSVPRQYAHARAHGVVGGKAYRGRSWPIDDCPADYKEVFDHFHSEMMGTRSLPSWHWKEFHKVMIEHLKTLGVDPNLCGLEVNAQTVRLHQFYTEPPGKPVEIPGMGLRKYVAEEVFEENQWSEIKLTSDEMLDLERDLPTLDELEVVARGGVEPPSLQTVAL